MSFAFMLACNCFFHWRTALSMTFCDMLAHMSMRRCFKLLVTAAGGTDRCLCSVHTFLHQSTNSVVNWTVWQTWRDKVQYFLLKELDCIIFRSITVSHVSFLEVCLCCLPKTIKISPWNHSLLTLAHFFWDTVYIHVFMESWNMSVSKRPECPANDDDFSVRYFFTIDTFKCPQKT